ncbi:efflux RND transporter periplasmic adaptor subunit [Pseudoalteromonas sp. T1lg24]|uniref:efflux RND transporter periplasmic adaptor subunit n=1 Tax=Pseudoalteromonas sp. T1lg24 TaxID=2077099 RepID=UPI000CF72AD0|nr:HlyD family efflux transporter periplasmic adaptor subunit [Pseudoalteromonas sp. T1lg24]
MNKFKLGLVASLIAFSLSGCGDDEFDYHTIEKTSLQLAVQANGELESAQQSLIAPPSISRMWQYKVKFLAPENKQVKKGEMVASFDDKPVRDRLIEKTSEYDRAVKELENQKALEIKNQEELKLALAEAQMNYDIAKRKADINDDSMSDNDKRKAQIDFTIAQNDLELAKKKLTFQDETKALNIRLAKGKAERLKAEVDALEQDIEKLKVKAPMDGIVMYYIDASGEKPTVGESVQFGQPVIELAVIEDMQVKAQIDEADFGRIALNQNVKVTIDGSEPIITSGKITSIGSAFREKSPQDKHRIVDTLIKLDNINAAAMRPGLTARVEIATDKIDDVLIVPVSALHSDQSSAYVIEKNGDKTPVTVGNISNGFAVIKSGIEQGEVVRL